MNAIFCADFLCFEQRKSILNTWHLQKWTKFHVTFAEEMPILDTTRISKEGKCAYRWDINTFKVVRCQGHVFLTSPMVEEQRNIMARGFVVWKLAIEGAESSSSFSPSPSTSLSLSSSPPSSTWVWSEVSRTPLQLLTILSCEKRFHPSFPSNGSSICMSSSHEPVIYDVRSGSWYCLTRKMQAFFPVNLPCPIVLGKAEAVRQKKGTDSEDQRYLDLKLYII
ncbi:hypothetical protein L7F22_031988 [Adiantum nelumboides]|nr:hypothetical protein [Adiantum nelumboides]